VISGRDPSLGSLIGALNRAIDPKGVWDRVRSLTVGLDIGGAFVSSNRPGIFSSPGARAVVSLEKEEVVFHEVPGPGQKAIFAGDTVTIFDRRGEAKIYDDMPSRLKKVGRDPRFILGVASEESGPAGLPFAAARTAVETASSLADFATFGMFGSVRKSAGIPDPKAVKLKKADLVYFFGYALRFYLRMVKMLEDPRTSVRRIGENDPIHREVPAKLGIGDSRDYIGLKVSWPSDVRTHSRDMDLFFDRRTNLLAFFRFDVDTLNDGFRAWYRTADWTQDPESGLMNVGHRRALVSPGGAEIPGQPWTVNARMGPMTAELGPKVQVKRRIRPPPI
jgi:hypothetical protein